VSNLSVFFLFSLLYMPEILLAVFTVAIALGCMAVIGFLLSF
jgi:hypothetical protein